MLNIYNMINITYLHIGYSMTTTKKNLCLVLYNVIFQKWYHSTFSRAFLVLVLFKTSLEQNHFQKYIISFTHGAGHNSFKII
jgi:hypothetical protein